jgi:uncharacterized protein (TIGR02996 family)
MTDSNRYILAAPDVPFARNADLEARIRNDPSDASSYLVYADWLTMQGDPRGELAVVQHELSLPALSHSENKDRRAELSLREQLILGEGGGFRGGVNALLAKVTWRLGMFDSLHFDNTIDWMDDDFETRAIARRLFDLPAASALQTLALGILRWEYQAEDVSAVLEEASRSVFASTLRRLRLGDVDRDVDNAHHSIGDIGIISRAFPRLERLRVWGHEITSSTPLELAALEEISIETCSLTHALYDGIVAAKLPRLQKLDLWFGSAMYGCNVGTGDLGPILDGSLFPALTHLGLKNAEMTDGIAEELVSSAMLARLRSVDLSMGTLSDDGARVLLRQAPAWRHLERLDVSASFLSPPMIGELSRVGPAIEAGNQKESHEPGHRYVSMRE